jgi:hypothetical protein
MLWIRVDHPGETPPAKHSDDLTVVGPVTSSRR